MRLFLLCVLFASASWAAQVQFSLSATVTQIDPLLAGSFSTGQAVIGLYTFESLTADSASAPESGVFFNAGTLFSVATGALKFVAGAVNITVSDTALVDIYRVEGSGVAGDALGAFQISSLVLALTDNTVPINGLASDALPLVPPALANFDVRTLTLVFVNGLTVASVVARVDSLTGSSVPEPGLAVPLALVLVLAGVTRRRGTRGAPKSL